MTEPVRMVGIAANWLAVELAAIDAETDDWPVGIKRSYELGVQALNARRALRASGTTEVPER